MGQGGGVVVAAGNRGQGSILLNPASERGEVHGRPAAEGNQTPTRQPQVQQQQRTGNEQVQPERVPSVAMQMETRRTELGGGQKAEEGNQQWPVMPQPFAPPPLPRHLLASRAEQLEAHIVELQKDLGDP